VAQHPGSLALPLDAADGAAMKRASAASVASGGLDHAIYCAGFYQDMSASTFDLATMLRHNQVNYVGALHMLDAVLPYFRAKVTVQTVSPSGQPTRSGHISLVGSVAGYRGLPKSLAYGPTKAALINLAETLYLDLHGSGIGVSLINPGFVETPLTADNDFDMPALISPDEAARQILKGWANGEFEIHFPKRFTFWMKVLQILPYRIFFPAVTRFTASAPAAATHP
jgi:short-subunit dehydrogenase